MSRALQGPVASEAPILPEPSNAGLVPQVSNGDGWWFRCPPSERGGWVTPRAPLPMTGWLYLRWADERQ